MRCDAPVLDTSSGRIKDCGEPATSYAVVGGISMFSRCDGHPLHTVLHAAPISEAEAEVFRVLES